VNASVSQRPAGRGRTALVKLDRDLNASFGSTDAQPTPRKIRPPRIGRAERDFMRALRGVAQQVGNLVGGYELNEAQVLVPFNLLQVLRAYAQALRPWAVSTVRRMLGEVDARDRDSWRSLGSSISSQLKHDLLRTPVGGVVRALMSEQVDLIQSLPIEAAERVHRLTIGGLTNSVRAKAIAEEIYRTGEVTESRAMLIARTEVARTASVLTETRARGAGVTHYRWQTAKDSDVRPGHRAMQGKICRWDDPPPVEENGRIMYFHPGRIWNCRCWAEPLVELEA
jgi:SPP1 gp7 family putative phage head morphogenesis protein